MDGSQNKPDVNDLVQLVRDKFREYMGNDVRQWEANQEAKDRMEMEGVKRLLLDHNDMCRIIYVVTMLLTGISFSLMSCASLGWLLGGLTLFLFTILVAQIITVRMRQRKALYYADVLDRYSQYPVSMVDY